MLTIWAFAATLKKNYIYRVIFRAWKSQKYKECHKNAHDMLAGSHK